MSKEEIQSRVNAIRESAGDYEHAHGEEDSLREDFIRYVSTLDIPELAAKAELVLSTSTIDFPRYCA